jgi:peptide deformylase
MCSSMAIRPLVILPDPQLRLVSDPVATIDDGVRRLADDMLDTMYEAPGIGLAAIQVGSPFRLVTIDISREEEGRKPQVFVNPEVLWHSGETSVYEEGCLSIPDYYEDVERPARVRVRYQTLAGETAEIEAEGILATCLQHEIDHLNGVLFIDHISRLKRDRVVRRFTKQARDKNRGVA